MLFSNDEKGDETMIRIVNHNIPLMTLEGLESGFAYLSGSACFAKLAYWLLILAILSPI